MCKGILKIKRYKNIPRVGNAFSSSGWLMVATRFILGSNLSWFYFKIILNYSAGVKIN